MDLKEYAHQLDELESKLDRLRALYEQYFQGLERLEPTIPRKDIERRIQALRRVQVRNTAMRFRFQQVLQKFTTYVTYWGRVARQIEEGTFRRDVLRMRKKRDNARVRRAEMREGYEPIDVGTEDFEVVPETAPSWDDVSEVTKTNPYRPGKNEKAPAASKIDPLPRPPLVPLIDRHLSDLEIDAALAGLGSRSMLPAKGSSRASKASPPKPPPPSSNSSARVAPPKPPPSSMKAVPPREGLSTGKFAPPPRAPISSAKVAPPKPPPATSRVPAPKKPSRAAMPAINNKVPAPAPQGTSASRAANPFKAKPKIKDTSDTTTDPIPHRRRDST